MRRYCISKTLPPNVTDPIGPNGLSGLIQPDLNTSSSHVRFGLANGAMPLSVALSLALLTACVGLLMVSNFVYYSPKRINLRERIPFLSLVLVTLGFAILLVDPPLVLLLIGVAYAASAPARAMAKLISKKINKPTA